DEWAADPAAQVAAGSVDYAVVGRGVRNVPPAACSAAAARSAAVAADERAAGPAVPVAAGSVDSAVAGRGVRNVPPAACSVVGARSAAAEPLAAPAAVVGETPADRCA